MTKETLCWEYKALVFSQHTLEGRVEELNVFGKEGWELAATMGQTGAFLKRLVVNQEQTEAGRR